MIIMFLMFVERMEIMLFILFRLFFIIIDLFFCFSRNLFGLLSIFCLMKLNLCWVSLRLLI